MRAKSDPLLAILPALAKLPIRSQILAMIETEPLTLDELAGFMPDFPRMEVSQVAGMLVYGRDAYLVRGRYVTNARQATIEAKRILADARQQDMRGVRW